MFPSDFWTSGVICGHLYINYPRGPLISRIMLFRKDFPFNVDKQIGGCNSQNDRK